jgi:putative membrane protein
MYGYSFGWAGVLMALFWIFVIAGVVWLVLAAARPQYGARGDDALRILEERLARGEIDAEEFRTRRAAIAEVRR